MSFQSARKPSELKVRFVADRLDTSLGDAEIDGCHGRRGMEGNQLCESYFHLDQKVHLRTPSVRKAA